MHFNFLGGPNTQGPQLKTRKPATQTLSELWSGGPIKVTIWGATPITERYRTLTGDDAAAFVAKCGDHECVFNGIRWESLQSTSEYICFTVME